MEQIVSDLTVVGGGIAGIAAAVTAARHGLHVALVQDREVLGGNVSSECQVSYGSGAINDSFYARESGISDEIKQRLFHANPRFRIKEDYYLIDDTLLQFVLAEPNISLFLGCSVYETEINEEAKERYVTSVKAFCARTQKQYRFVSPMFMDASGDGIVAYQSGAEYREGREARSEYGEVLAPEFADNGKMGSCILFNVAKADHPVPFVKPSFAYDYEKDGILSHANRPHTGRELPNTFEGMTGLWWLSWGGFEDTVRDAYAIDLELKKLVYGYWDYVKNSGVYSDMDNYYMRWVAPFAAKRESRRFVGDYVLTQNDICNGVLHEDDVSTGGWSIDCHDPGGVYGDGPVSLFGYVPAMYNIPYRCMYSKNITNLFLGGRIVSATHLALGSLRVVQTLAAMAQAAGSAAVLCKKYDCKPRDISTAHCKELQTMLQRDGQYIIGLPEDCGIAAEASITSSGDRRMENCIADHELILDRQYCLCIPTEHGNIDDLELYIRNVSDKVQKLEYTLWDNPLCHTYAPVHLRRTDELSIPPAYDGWIKVKICLQEICGKKVYLILGTNDSLRTTSTHHHITGVPTFEYSANRLRRCGENLSFRNVMPDENLYLAENVVNGISRPVGIPNAWVAEPHETTHLHFDFRQTRRIREVQLVMNAQHWKIDLNVNEVLDQIISDFDIVFFAGSEETKRITVRSHYLPVYKTECPAVTCDSIRIDFHKTKGSPYFELFSVKIFE